MSKIAGEHKFTLPANPDSKALEEFLTKQKAADPLLFPHLSLAIIKLLVSGEYIAELGNWQNPPGTLWSSGQGLFLYSTAPNRRYPDLITQRMLKAAIEGKPIPL